DAGTAQRLQNRSVKRRKANVIPLGAHSAAKASTANCLAGSGVTSDFVRSSPLLGSHSNLSPGIDWNAIVSPLGETLGQNSTPRLSVSCFSTAVSVATAKRSDSYL